MARTLALIEDMHKMHLAHHELESIVNIVIINYCCHYYYCYYLHKMQKRSACLPLGSHWGVPSCSLLHTYAWTPPRPDSSEWLPETQHECNKSLITQLMLTDHLVMIATTIGHTVLLTFPILVDFWKYMAVISCMLQFPVVQH